MKQAALVTLSAGLLLAWATASGSDEGEKPEPLPAVTEVLNGGFEEGPADEPTGWRLDGNHAGSSRKAWQARAVEVPFAGKRALRLETVPAPLKKAPAGARMAARLRAPFTVPHGKVTFRYRVLAGPGENLFVAVIGTDAKGITVGSLGPAFKGSAGVSGDGHWHEGAVTYDRGRNPFATGAQLWIGLSGTGGAVLVDEVRLSAEPPEGEKG